LGGEFLYYQSAGDYVIFGFFMFFPACGTVIRLYCLNKE